MIHLAIPTFRSTKMDEMEMDLDAPTHLNGTLMCYQPNAITSFGSWHEVNPLEYSLPLFILQSIIIIVTIRTSIFILKCIGQSKVIAEIIGGLVLGPTGLGHIIAYGKAIFPMRSIMVLETMANIGLLYFLFLVGVEMDIGVVKRASRQSFITAVVSVVVPIILSTACGLVISQTFKDQNINMEKFVKCIFFLSVSLSATTFSVQAGVIADLKLIESKLARISTSVAAINDILTWTILIAAISMAKIKDNDYSIALTVFFGNIIFVFFCFMVIRPIIMWMVVDTPDEENINEFYIYVTITGVMICGFITDAIGSTSVFGAFVFGLIIPRGKLRTTLLEKLEELVTTFLLPVYFATSGLRTNMTHPFENSFTNCVAFYMMVIPSFVKVIITSLTSLFYDMELHEAIALGVLMNTKGLMELIVLNIGVELKIVDANAYSVVVLASLVMTVISTPIVGVLFKGKKKFKAYKRRTIQKAEMINGELNIIMCIHTYRNIPTMIKLLEASHATKKSPIYIYALHLVELTGRATSMLIEHNAHKTSSASNNNTNGQSESILNAFETYAQVENFTVQPLSVFSSYSTMHENICSLAEDKKIALIIVPFHMQQTVDGGMEPTHPAIRHVNQNILANAPCSVGILIDRGLGGSANHISHNVAVIFVGGPDDREALAYGWRIARHPTVNLSVIQLVVHNNNMEPTIQIPYGNKSPSVITANDGQRQLDQEYIADFKRRTISQDTVTYKEMIVNSSGETVAVIRSLDNTYELYIVGRGHGNESPIKRGLNDFSECPELGAVGDYLASSDFAEKNSVLVVQQYVGEKMNGDESSTSSPAE